MTLLSNNQNKSERVYPIESQAAEIFARKPRPPRFGEPWKKGTLICFGDSWNCKWRGRDGASLDSDAPIDSVPDAVQPPVDLALGKQGRELVVNKGSRISSYIG